MRVRSGVLDNLPLLGLVHLGLCRRHASNCGCGCPSGGDSSSGTDHGVCSVGERNGDCVQSRNPEQFASNQPSVRQSGVSQVAVRV